MGNRLWNRLGNRLGNRLSHRLRGGQLGRLGLRGSELHGWGCGLHRLRHGLGNRGIDRGGRLRQVGGRE